MIRLFELRDLPILHRYRKRGLFLDSVPTLTWGRALVPAGAALSPLSSAMGLITAFYQDEDKTHEPVIAQVAHSAGASFARFTFIAPDSGIDSPALNPLLEELIRRVGDRGAKSLIAEVDEKSQTFETLRKANFSIYARQSIWRIGEISDSDTSETGWSKSQDEDEVNIWRLTNAVVPSLVQQVEASPKGQLNGWVYYHGGEMLGFAAMLQGPQGTWIQPFIHPEMEDVGEKIRQLISIIGPKRNRPLYICLRSYQAWLKSEMESLGAEPGVDQAVMVRRLAVSIKKPALSPIPQMKNGTEPTTTFYENPKKQKSN